MATAGSGDVLTGIIGAMLSQRLSCRDAALAGVLAHARAGDLAARDIGEIGMIAGDITARLPAVWKAASS
jgi:NAD(P)H-hydrate epimerase